MINYPDKEFLKKLQDLKKNDPDRFMEIVLDTLKQDEELAITDKTPVENKLTAIATMTKRLEELQRYEDCAFLKKLKEKILEKERS